jgi:hypothetical protein
MVSAQLFVFVGIILGDRFSVRREEMDIATGYLYFSSVTPNKGWGILSRS